MQNNTCTTTVETMLGGMKKELTDNLGNRHARPRKFKSFFPHSSTKALPLFLPLLACALLPSKHAMATSSSAATPVGGSHSVRPVNAFSLAHFRALANLPSLKALHPLADSQMLLSGMKALAERVPELKAAGALARRAAHEVDKYEWAFPNAEGDSVAHVASHGFNHAAAILARLRGALPRAPSSGSIDDAQLDKLLAKAFRAAVKARKANAEIDVEHEALKQAQAMLATL